MKKSCLEAFCDGVLAIIITIMAMELKVLGGQDLNEMVSLLSSFLSYILVSLTFESIGTIIIICIRMCIR